MVGALLKPDPDFLVCIQASIAGSAIATLQKELSAASSAQKITKSVKAPTVKPAEARVRAEATPSPQFPFADTPDTYKSQAGIEVKKEVGVSITGATVHEERFTVRREHEAKVSHRMARCSLMHCCRAGPAHGRFLPQTCSAGPPASPLPRSDFILLSLEGIRALFPRVIFVMLHVLRVDEIAPHSTGIS